MGQKTRYGTWWYHSSPYFYTLYQGFKKNKFFIKMFINYNRQQYSFTILLFHRDLSILPNAHSGTYISNSEKGAHEWSKSVIWHLFKSTAVANLKFISKQICFSSHVRNIFWATMMYNFVIMLMQYPKPCSKSTTVPVTYEWK